MSMLGARFNDLLQCLEHVLHTKHAMYSDTLMQAFHSCILQGLKTMVACHQRIT